MVSRSKWGQFAKQVHTIFLTFIEISVSWLYLLPLGCVLRTRFRFPSQDVWCFLDSARRRFRECNHLVPSPYERHCYILTITCTGIWTGLDTQITQNQSSIPFRSERVVLWTAQFLSDSVLPVMFSEWWNLQYILPRILQILALSVVHFCKLIYYTYILARCRIARQLVYTSTGTPLLPIAQM